MYVNKKLINQLKYIPMDHLITWSCFSGGSKNSFGWVVEAYLEYTHYMALLYLK